MEGGRMSLSPSSICLSMKAAEKAGSLNHVCCNAYDGEELECMVG